MKSMINLDGKIFVAKDEVRGGDVNALTVFYYHQEDDYIWAHYRGGMVAAGVLLGKMVENKRLDFTYRHFDQDGKLKEGTCHTLMSIEADGRIQLNETWQWTSGQQGSGTSILIEKKTN